MNKRQSTDTIGYPAFDWLRFFLASIVVLYHFDVIPWHRAGNLAVQVFFALSGWLIGGILVRSDTKHLPRFYFNRATRIWIPYFFAIALFYGFSAAREHITSDWLTMLAYDVTFAHNWFAFSVAHWPQGGDGFFFWSISVEEQFYLLAPIIIYTSHFGRSPALWGVVSAVLIAVGQPDFASIAAGVCATALKERAIAWPGQGAISGGAAAVAIASIPFLILDATYNYAAPIFAICVVLTVSVAGRRGRGGQFVGGVSYPLYLNHWIGGYIAHAFTRHLVPSLAGANGLLAAGFGLVIGTLAYFGIDRNVMARRDAWYSREAGMTCAVFAYTLLTVGLIIGIVSALRLPFP